MPVAAAIAIGCSYRQDSDLEKRRVSRSGMKSGGSATGRLGKAADHRSHCRVREWKQGRKGDVGEFRKTCHPRNVEIYEVREMSFQEKRTHEGLES
jgi:hypothetical protein